MALTDILHKGVVPYVVTPIGSKKYMCNICNNFCLSACLLYCSRSLDTLFDSPKLDNDLKAMLKANFSEFYPQG